jgi:hypothetical protein
MAIFLEQIKTTSGNTGDILRIEGNSLVPYSVTETEKAPLTAGENIVLDANGLISAQFTVDTDSVSEGNNNLYYTDKRVYANVSMLKVSHFSNDVGYAKQSDLYRLNTSHIREGDNLYYTEVRVKDYLDKNIKPYDDKKVAEYISANVTSSDIAEGDNLYFTDERVVKALKAGDKISISDDGTVAVESGGSGSFNTDIDNSIGYSLSHAMNIAVAFEKDSVIHSIRLTNTTDKKQYIASASVVLSTSVKQSEYLLDDVKVPYGSSVEILCKPQVVKAGDKLRMQGFLDGVPTGGAVHATIVYETVGVGYERVARGVVWNEDAVVYTSIGKPSIIESIKAVNVDPNKKDHGLRILWKGSDGNVKGYICNNFVIPARSTVEFCDKPHRLSPGDIITASASHSDAIALFISAIRK